MKKSHILLTLLGMGATLVAHADDFNFSWVGSETAAYGSLSGTSNGDGTFTIDSGSMTVTEDNSGTLDLTTYALVAGSGNDGLFIYDNQLAPSGSPELTNAGLLFSNSVGVQEINIYTVGSTYYFAANTSGAGGSGAIYNPGDPGQFSTQAVPEPISMSLLGVGALGLLRRRKSA